MRGELESRNPFKSLIDGIKDLSKANTAGEVTGAIDKIKDSFNKAVNNIKALRNKFPVLKININTTLTPDLANDKEDIIDIINFAESIKANVKIMELFPVEKSQEIVSLDKVKFIIEDIGYKLKSTKFRKNTYEKNGHEITLLKCTCSAVCEYEDKGKACYDNNDIYLSMDGNLHLCRNRPSAFYS